MLIAMAGLPATGKTTLVERLAKEVGGVVLSKDQVRAALFPSSVLDYSKAEDEISMNAIFNAAAYIRRTFPDCPVLFDGLDGGTRGSGAVCDGLCLPGCVGSSSPCPPKIAKGQS